MNFQMHNLNVEFLKYLTCISSRFGEQWVTILTIKLGPHFYNTGSTIDTTMSRDVVSVVNIYMDSSILMVQHLEVNSRLLLCWVCMTVCLLQTVELGRMQVIFETPP